MRVSKTPVVVAAIVLAFATPLSAQSPGGNPFVAGQILVKFTPGAAANARADAHRLAGGTSLLEITRTGVQLVGVPVGDEAAAIARYERNPNVLYAEPNFIRSIPEPSSHTSGSEVVPGDHYFGEQWALNNTGQYFYCLPFFGCLYLATADADIDAPEGWAISTGTSDVTVAMIDSGIDYTHPDLAPNYAGGDNFTAPGGDPMDGHGHGTHTAGTVAAALNNLTGTPAEDEGVVGVAPHARLLAYKVCTDDGSCTDSAIQQAIGRAVDDGAKVINMSLGGGPYSQSTYDAVQNAWNANVVIVAAAGNNGTTDLVYPAAYDHVVSVAGFDEDGKRAPFSTYGDWVDISAPANVILSTYPMADCVASTEPGDIGCYNWLSGTSMAAPHVAGAAALLWSRPDVTTNSQVVDILLNSADGRGASNVRLDSWTIHGGLNLHDALSYSSTRPVANAGAAQTVTDSDGDGAEMVSLDGTASSDPNGSIVSYAWREGSASIAVGATPDVWLSVGVHTLTLDVTDNDGESASDSVVVTVNPASLVSVTASTLQGTEAGPTSGTFTVSRTGSTSVPLIVHYTVGGTAVAGTDYVLLPGAVTLHAGSSSATIAVTPIDDLAVESDESVVLTVSPGEAYGAGTPGAATVTIVSDDLPSDLAVTSMTAPATGGSDADIVVTDTTKNQGAGPAPASATGFYLSTNSSLDAADVWLGSRPVLALGPGATQTLSTTMRVPASTATGSYYVLGKADWNNAVEEGIETNNVRASGVVKIGPDLIVTALSAPSSAAPGATITVTDTTKNQGSGAASASSTAFYLSANTALDAADVLIGSRPVGAFASGGAAAASTPFQIPANLAPGSYYVIGRADTNNTVAETVEFNNNKTGGVIRIGGDLVLSALSASAAAKAGDPFTVSDATTNQGAASVAGSATGLYLSPNTLYNSTDVFLGSRVVGALQPSETSTASMPLVIPSGTAPGIYFVVGVADFNNAVMESLESNNVRSSTSVRIGPDLLVTSLTVPSSAVAGTSLSASDTTANQGADTSPATATRFFLSTNSSLDAQDLLLASRPVLSLAPGQSDAGSAALPIPASTAAGTYYIIAKGDGGDAVAESSESNNTRTRSISISAP